MQTTHINVEQRHGIFGIDRDHGICTHLRSCSHHRIEVGKKCVIECEHIMLNRIWTRGKVCDRVTPEICIE